MTFPYTISQSLVKKFLKNGDELPICPKYIYETAITGNYKEPPTIPRLNGSYFETLVLGSGRGGHKTLDLPRKKITKDQQAKNAIRIEKGLEPLPGTKKIDQIRIEEQAERFKILSAQRQIMISEYNTQVPIVKKWDKDPNVFLRGELDIFPTPILGKDGLQMAIIDVKLTGDVDNNFGDFCWGDPFRMDHIQGQMYHYLVRDINPMLNKGIRNIVTPAVTRMIDDNRVLFLYWVFSYGSGDLKDKFVRYDWEPIKEAELHESIRKTVSILEDNDTRGWKADPEYERCSKCPVKECAERCEIQAV